MPTIVEPESYEKEEIMQIPVASSGTQCMAVSGYANFFTHFLENTQENFPRNNEPIGSKLQGSQDYDVDVDEFWNSYTVHLIVGSRWQSVRDVSPIVTVAGFAFGDSDSANRSGTQIDTCTWDTVGLSEDDAEFERIRLKVELRMCGGYQYNISKLAYHFVAVGRQ